MSKFTIEDKAKMFDALKETISKEIELNEARLENDRFHPDLVEMSLVNLKWIRSLMDDYFTLVTKPRGDKI